MDQKRPEGRQALFSRAQALMASEPGFARFFSGMVESAEEADLHTAGPELEDRLRAAYKRLDPWSRGIRQVHVSDDGVRTSIDAASPDMPFIVDSVLSTIRAESGTIRFIAHPVFASEGERAGSRLSVLHIELDPLSAADRQRLKEEIERTLNEVEKAVSDWQPMLARLHEAARSLERAGPAAPAHLRMESAYFLDWLTERNFTFLGMRDYGLNEGAGLELVPGSGLGILRDPSFKFLRSGAAFVEMTPQHAAFLKAREPVMVTKANVRSRVHRRVHLDFIGVKLYADDGALRGELRILGLFTSQALARAHADVPLIRIKIEEVVRRSGLDPASHAGKALLNALDTYPRDELFQIDVADLAEYTAAIAALPDRPRVRVLPRIDPFDNFVSILVYVPRERYDSEVRARLGDYLASIYDGRVSAYYPHFPEGELVRVHFIIGRVSGPTPRPTREVLEAAVDELTQNFGDQLLAAGGPDAAEFRNAFSPGYQTRHTVDQALADIAVLKTLTDATQLAVRLYRAPDGRLGLKVYHLGSPIPLSQRVPMLEAFGFQVIEEQTHQITPRGSTPHVLHDMVLDSPVALDPATHGPTLEAALLAVWSGEAESDGLNQLTLRAGLPWRDVALLRALSRYLRQAGLTYGQRYVAQVLVAQASAAVALLTLFHALHDPDFPGDRTAAAEQARGTIATTIQAATSLDEDRILRRVLNLVEASLRTNFYQPGAQALAIKFDSGKIEALPAPHPFREIFVYSPRVEGIHLRFGPIARGGLRWSDRPEDFRTEILGLVKAQQVKNAIIVPVGAKGGFVPKLTSVGAAREVVQAEGIACYKIFINSLLDLTDNLSTQGVVHPPRVVRRDGDDPYLVVAADKGTASFSDTANAIALGRGFWLGDAFASGGSAGYDHKAMGITARGAFEAVKRHFREMDRDILREPFTVAGVGDMSGDVFGNGMLLSRATRLVAAFDHRDIFLDPAPDPEASFEERERLFNLPRSSWQDYDKGKLSAGGGVFSRSLKSIPLSPQVRESLGLAADQATPQEVITAILSAEVDLLWFGGIGTYVRASAESDADVGDRANDAFRIPASALKASVIGEGANLAMTQRARIEYALSGGRLNTDAIDNSGGVNSSDLEVNIKIALGPLLADGTLSLEARNRFLAGMTEEVAALCLRNNYLQTLALSLEQRNGMAQFPAHRDLIETLEARGLLDRTVEYLPSTPALEARAGASSPLSRPELAVLLAYAKLTLYNDLLGAEALADPYLANELFLYFPDTLTRTYPDTIANHRLRREVIATVLSNAMINRGGPAFVTELMATSSAGSGDIAFAFLATRDVYRLSELNSAIDSLDGKIPGAIQLSLYGEVQTLLRREALWFLRNAPFKAGLADLIARHAAGVATVEAVLPALMPPSLSDLVALEARRYHEAGVPEPLGRRIATLPTLGYSTDIVLIAERLKLSVEEAAEAFFGVFSAFELGVVIEQGRDLVLEDRYDRMALDRALANLLRGARDLSADVLLTGSGPVRARMQAWQDARPAAIARAIEAVRDLTRGQLTVSKLSVTAGLLTDLARGS